MKKQEIFQKSVAAGFMIGIGAIIKLLSTSSVLGAVLFSVGLFFICSFGMYLFTGKIAYVNKENLLDYPVIWGGNFLGCIVAAVLIRIANPSITATANALMLQKLEGSLPKLAALAFFCGVIMYLAVDNYKNSKSDVSKVFGIVIGVTVFLLCGFEHSIADMAYASFGVQTAGEALRFVLLILWVSVFNGVGSLAMRYLLKPKNID